MKQDLSQEDWAEIFTRAYAVSETILFAELCTEAWDCARETLKALRGELFSKGLIVKLESPACSVYPLPEFAVTDGVWHWCITCGAKQFVGLSPIDLSLHENVVSFILNVKGGYLDDRRGRNGTLKEAEPSRLPQRCRSCGKNLNQNTPFDTTIR